MTSWDYRGYTVNFPCDPYPSQKEFTEKVLDSLLEGSNGLLESPTGTGKTLALLSAGVAWLQHSKGKANDACGFNSLPGAPNASSNVDQGNFPRVFYSSRTHSQLAQVMSQLKHLEFPSAVALGSRDQLCVHPAVKGKGSVGEKNKMCNFLVKSKQCEFYHNYSKSEGLSGLLPSQNAIMDIEDLVSQNSRQKICPYYKSREMASKAEFIFLPYNYLLDRNIRKSLPAHLSGGLVIVDEAHNVTKVCEESSSLVFDTQQIALAIHELQSVIKIMEDEESSIELPVEEISLEDAYLLKETLLNMENIISKEISSGDLKVGGSYPGNYLISILEKSNMNYSRSSWLCHVISVVLDALGSLSSLGAQNTGKGLDVVMSLLSTAYSDRSHDLSSMLLQKYYKLHITKNHKNDKIFVFNLWCFHPGLAMRSITECGTRSLILTSGTLKPIDAMLQELDIPFKVQFSGPHIITEKQIFVRAISKGVNNIELLSTFQNRNNSVFLDSLGRTVLEIMKNIPNGMLVFFPSYGMMDSCVQSWKKTFIWDEFCRVKTTLLEPRDKTTFEVVVNEFKKKAEDRSRMGACLMAVCRGKISEGIDFSDNMARAVLVIGIPYPNAFEARINLKRDYVDKRKTEDQKLLTGSQWYQLEAFRAINQAVGRVIRHKNDFGGIFFLDKRFSESNVKSNLPDWVRKNVENSTLNGAISAAKTFFEDFSGLSKDNTIFTSASSHKDAPTTLAKFQFNDRKRKWNQNEASSLEKNPAKSAKKKFVIKSSANNVLRYKNVNVVQRLKQKLSKEELLKFKALVNNYKLEKDLTDLKSFLSALYSEDKIDISILIGIKEFILENDTASYEDFLKSKS